MSRFFGSVNPRNSPISFNTRGKENSTLNSNLKPAASVETLAAKSFQLKSKGLSIRSKSDLNISAVKNANLVINKRLSAKSISTISPLKLLTPKKKFENYANKKLSPKILSPILTNVTDEFIFNKPATPNDKKKPIIVEEPEKLAYSWNIREYLDEETEAMFREDAKLFKQSHHSSSDSLLSMEEDSGFISDSGQESFNFLLEIPIVLQEGTFEITLPEISDEEY